MYRIILALLLCSAIASAQLTNTQTQVPLTDYAPRPTASVAGLQTTVNNVPTTSTSATVPTTTVSNTAVTNTIANNLLPQNTQLTTEQRSTLNNDVNALGQQFDHFMNDLFGSGTTQQYGAQTYNPYAVQQQYSPYAAQYNPYTAQQYNALLRQQYGAAYPTTFTTQAVDSTDTTEGRYPGGLMDCPAHWERRWGLGPACKPRQHNVTVNSYNNTDDTAPAYALIERVERIVMSNGTDSDNNTMIAVETFVTDLLIPLNNTNTTAADNTDFNNSDFGTDISNMFDALSVERNNVTIGQHGRHGKHSNRTHRTNSTARHNTTHIQHRFDILAENRHNERTGRMHNNDNNIQHSDNIHQFSTQASLPSLPNIDTSSLPSFDSSMISTQFDRTITQMPSMMAAVQPIIAQIQSDPPTSLPAAPYTAQSYGSNVNLGSNAYQLPTTTYDGNFAGATQYGSAAVPYTASTGSANAVTGYTSTSNDPVATAESLGITYQHYNDPTTIGANAPKPAATCAITDVHCQMYKSCYPCYRTQTPMCMSCLQLAQCTNLACQIQQACNVCSSTGNSAQMCGIMLQKNMCTSSTPTPP